MKGTQKISGSESGSLVYPNLLFFGNPPVRGLDGGAVGGAGGGGGGGG